ncbi:MAG: hypothetical protein M3Z10_01770 [Gemmatimonadota bacterium]|nr:hypothetical protein [Gemmatimonadota bacterium]
MTAPPLASCVAIAMLLGSASCTGAPDREPVARPPASASATASSTTPVSGRGDPWVAAADSALHRYPAHEMYTARGDSLRGFRECSQEGGENSLAYLAAARARVLSHDTVTVVSADDFSRGRAKQLVYKVELTLAAQLVPYWALELRPDSAMGDVEPYVAEVGVRVDTVIVDISQGLESPRKEWVSCGPAHGINQEVYLDFAKPPMEQSTFVKVLRWDPPGGSWAEIRRLADSIAAAPR